MGEHSVDHGFDGLLDDAHFFGVAFEEGLGHIFHLLEGDVGGQNEGVWIDQRLQDYRSASREGLIPRRADLFRPRNTDPLEAAALRKFRIREIGKVLGGFEFCVAGHDALLPGDHVEVVVVEDQADQARVGPFLPIFADGDHGVEAVHLHGAVAGESDGDAVGEAEFCGDGVGDGGAHGGEVAGAGGHHAAADLEVAGVPVGGGAGVGGEDAVVGEARGEFPEDALGVDGVGGVHGLGFDFFHHLAFQSAIFSAPGAVGFSVRAGAEGLEGFGGVAFEVDFHGVAEREHAAVEVDLDAAGFADRRDRTRRRGKRSRRRGACRSLSSCHRKVGAEEADASR